MAMATGFGVFTIQQRFAPRRALLPTAAALVLELWFYQSLPLVSFVLHSFLPYRIGDNLKDTCYGFSVRLDEV